VFALSTRRPVHGDGAKTPQELFCFIDEPSPLGTAAEQAGAISVLEGGSSLSELTQPKLLQLGFSGYSFMVPTPEPVVFVQHCLELSLANTIRTPLGLLLLEE